MSPQQKKKKIVKKCSVNIIDHITSVTREILSNFKTLFTNKLYCNAIELYLNNNKCVN